MVRPQSCMQTGTQKKKPHAPFCLSYYTKSLLRTSEALYIVLLYILRFMTFTIHFSPGEDQRTKEASVFHALLGWLVALYS